jgi:hypothetical protein
MIPANGSYNISTNWTVKGAFDFNFTSNGPLPNGTYQLGFFYLGHGICLIDLTSPGSPTCRYSGGPIAKSFSNGTGKYAFAWTSHTKAPRWTFVTGHKYVLETFISCEIGAFTDGGIPGGTISLKLDLHTAPKLGATLNAYSIRG